MERSAKVADGKQMKIPKVEPGKPRRTCSMVLKTHLACHANQRSTAYPQEPSTILKRSKTSVQSRTDFLQFLTPLSANASHTYVVSFFFLHAFCLGEWYLSLMHELFSARGV